MRRSLFPVPAAVWAIALGTALLAPKDAALAQSIDGFSFPMTDLRIEIGPSTLPGDDGARTATAVVGDMVISSPREWEALATGGEKFSLRHREWRGSVHFDIDCAVGSVSLGAAAQTFVPLGGREPAVTPAWQKVLEGVSCKQDAQGMKRVVTIPSVSLSCRLADKHPKITMGKPFDSVVLSGAEGWELEVAGVFLYRLRRREWGSGKFWEVDAARRTATSSGGKRLAGAEREANAAPAGVQVQFVGKVARGGVLGRIDHTVRKKRVQPDKEFQHRKEFQALFVKSEESAVPVLRADSVSPNGKTPPPASRWREKEKESFRRALAGEPCDVLVVPFQVQGWAVDRIERALMTRYLSDAIARATGLRLPNPTLVARALGDGARAIADGEIYRLANDLRAKTLIMGFVGHDREEGLKVTLLVQERRGAAPFGAGSDAVRLTWGGLPFSDERLPSEAFLDVVGDVLAGAFPGGTKPLLPAPAATAAALPLPAALGEAAGGGNDPVRNAFTLQLLGLLVPGDGTLAESFFERSLVALRGVSPKSPDYPLLKASAWASLHRRPAALAALGTPAAAEGQALQAYLNGDLPALREWVARIARPVPRLMARIRLIDLEQRFGGDQEALAREKRALVEEHRGFGEILAVRLEQDNQWAQPSAFPLKRGLDALFPVAGQRLEDLAARAGIVGGETSEEDVDLALFNHYHQVLTGGLYTPGGSASPVPGDALDLLFAASQRVAVKRIGRLIQVQALFEEGLEVLGRYERLYPDHLELTYLKVSALRNSLKAGGEADRQTDEAAADLTEKLFFWSDGQSPAAATAARFLGRGLYALPSYDADYPHRPFWRDETLGDRRSLAGFAAVPGVAALPVRTRHGLKNALVGLAYTISDLGILRDLYGKLSELGLRAEARAVLEANRGRFQGHGLWPDLLAQAEIDASGEGGARRVYEQAIAATPLNFDPYFELGKIMIGEGDFAGASRTFLSYPLFSDPGRGDRVQLSHAVYVAAIELLFHGAVKEAIPLLELCVGFGTGSGSEMGALGYLAQLRGDFPETALLLRDRGNRYQHRVSYGLCSRLLHAMGFHREADALFDSLGARLDENSLWNDAVIGLRIAGKTDAEVVAWFQERPIGSSYLDVNDGESLVLAFLVDRGANDLLPRFLSAREDAAELYTPWFAEGFRLVKLGRYEEAYRTLLTRLDEPGEESIPAFRYAFPALAWAGVRSGNADEVAALLQRYEEVLGKDFHYHLALAMLQGGKGDAEAAVVELRRSWYSMDVDYPPIDFSYPWYQLLEAAEWLQAASPRQDYLDLIVRWSKICQQLYPTEAWSYAMEALYTPSAQDRTRALALGLFLDRNSERLSGFSVAEREAARVWLRDNNPFVVKRGERKDPNNTF